MSKLVQDSRVAIVGAGPAGSLFALHLSRFARQVGLRLRITLFEPRLFESPGPAGCNKCAGILSSSLVHNLSRLGLCVPDHVIANRIGGYRLHTCHGSVEAHQPHPLEPILSVFRGCGPRAAGTLERDTFDGHLLRCAVDRGVELRKEEVDAVGADGLRPQLMVDGRVQGFDLLVLAVGVNSRLGRNILGPYRAPATRSMVQNELALGRSTIADRIGDNVHVFLLPGRRLVFATMVPKGEFVTVSLMGATATPLTMEEFLADPLVQQLIPAGTSRSCRCRPRISVGQAIRPYGERFVVVGDAATSRLYKDGIGSAYQTARQAAWTAVFHGVAERDFARHFHPLCKAIDRDNAFGRALFAVHRRLKDSRTFFVLQDRLLASERTAPFPARQMDPLNWGMFTGAESYTSLFRRLLSPRLWSGFVRAALARTPPPAAVEIGLSMAGKPPSSGRREAPGVLRRVRRVLILGGGFAGVHTALQLERRLGREGSVEVVLVSKENFFLFTPLLHEAATGGVETRHIAIPIRRLRGYRRFAFRNAAVRSIDLESRGVRTSLGDVEYDSLVLALGSTTDMRDIQGQEDRVLRLKCLGDAIALRNHVIGCFERACVGDGDASSLLTFVVVGGGITGVQLASALNDFCRRYLPRDYIRVPARQVRVLLVQDEPSVLPEMDGRFAAAARDALEAQGVEVLTGVRVTEVGERSLTTSDGIEVPTETIIWTPGIVANPVVSALQDERDEIGRVVVDDTLRVPGRSGVYALGDNAHLLDPATGLPLPATAHIAIRQPRTVAHNIWADMHGRQRRPYVYRHMGQLVSLGPRTALADLYGLRFTGLGPRVLWSLAYAGLMKGRYNQARVVTDWALGVLFGRDSTLLRGFGPTR